MKITKTEKNWLIIVTLLFVAYNLPFVPGYDNAVGTLVHGAITLVSLWVAVYVGLLLVSGKKISGIERSNSSDNKTEERYSAGTKGCNPVRTEGSNHSRKEGYNPTKTGEEQPC
ncbi:MAG: hypothetical protein Q4B85_10220 [Lachnospiraceae bacterium]|nr:hypothetical protein [Lachnospiraceae bacterium]